MLIVTIIPSFPHSLFITGFVTRVTLTGDSGLGTMYPSIRVQYAPMSESTYLHMGKASLE
jgi:hypothetical protein